MKRLTTSEPRIFHFTLVIAICLYSIQKQNAYSEIWICKYFLYFHELPFIYAETVLPLKIRKIGEMHWLFKIFT